ncbi:hypothetical protein [endosymbiont of Lamellibrachia barhami]|uniref:hypothetical protein n=1 Tax=endosymbiont of Lamellibrachia barhami TaxID=205975 RepID=UPI0015B3474B|nr:hypothetical protein [endosymbiont of Lamellibrachia barhami]
METALPAPPQQPTLTAAPTSALTPALAIAQPAIRQFETGVNPSRIRHGETLKLMLTSVVESEPYIIEVTV